MKVAVTKENLIKLNVANIKYSVHTYMNHNTCINLREGHGKQGPLRRKLLMKQAKLITRQSTAGSVSRSEGASAPRDAQGKQQGR